MTDEPKPPKSTLSPEKVALNKNLESVGWGLFLIMIGGIALVPDRIVTQGIWLIGAGVIMLGLNLARYLKQIPVSGFTTVLGFIALASGISEFAKVDLPWFPILLILIGANILYKRYTTKE